MATAEEKLDADAAWRDATFARAHDPDDISPGDVAELLAEHRRYETALRSVLDPRMADCPVCVRARITDALIRDLP